MTTRPRLVILGSTVTALAVARNAADRAMRPIVIDTQTDVATRTRRAEVRLLIGATPDVVLAELARAATDGPAWLVATSDMWLRFVAKYRIQLQQSFADILHPDNAALAICLG